MKIVLASTNKGKIEEIRGLLQGLPVEVLTLDEFPEIELPPETGSSFKDNALVKARFVAEKTGCTALADDSGLQVEALGGRPGVRSARYAGEGATDRENNAKLLVALKDVPPGKRGARFVCAVALVEPSGAEETFEGQFEGEIGFEPRGEDGFGYDPIFMLSERGRTVAELPPGEKNRISHRAEALAKLRERLRRTG
ncbi:MAG: XTP/dITP diphosphatase [Thermodesulfobacteriota bacterium]